MKYSEFNHDWSDMELQYSDTEMYIYCDGIMIGKVSRQWRYLMSTHYEGFELLPIPVAVKLFADMAMLAETPLAEREEEKRYRLRKIPIPLLREASDRFYRKPLLPNYGPCTSNDITDSFQYQIIFTESEIAEMDITGFQKVEVTP